MPEPRIAVDVRPLCHPATGIYRYTYELLRRMCAMGGQWYFYSPQAYDQADFSASNIVHRMARAPDYLGGSQVSQALFPFWARRDRIDVFWAPRHHLPLLLDSSIRSVLTVHDLVWLKHGELMPATRRFTESTLMPRSLRRADAIVTCSAYVARQVAGAFPATASRLSVIPEASCFEPDAVARPADAVASGYFLFVGTMEPRKNLPTLLAAYRRYLRTCSAPRRLKLVGGQGWGGIDPVGLVISNGLQGWVDLPGQVSDAELASLYAGAYALLMPSIYEGFGLPVVESVSFGVPVIVSENSAVSEVAGAAGMEVDPLSEASICEALTTITVDGEKYRRLRNNALARRSQFSWGGAATSLYTLLRSRE